MMKSDMEKLIGDLQSKIKKLTSEKNILQINSSNQNKQIIKQKAIINRYKKMINELQSKVKDGDKGELRGLSSFECSSPVDPLSPSPVKYFKQSSLVSNSPEPDECSSSSRRNITFGSHLVDGRNSPRLLNIRKYIEIRRISSVEPAFKELLKSNTIFQLLHNATIQIK